MKASKANTIITGKLRGVFMQSMISKKGWTQIEARSYIVEWVTFEKNLSFADFMESK